MSGDQVKALVLTGYGLNCDYETDYCLNIAGAASERVHINELIKGEEIGKVTKLEDYQIIAFDGGFSWADDHGAGILLGARLRYNIGDQLEQFIKDGKLIIGICNGFQALVNLGLLPGFNGNLAGDHRPWRIHRQGVVTERCRKLLSEDRRYKLLKINEQL